MICWLMCGQKQQLKCYHCKLHVKHDRSEYSIIESKGE
jgi:hypothetical protein